MYVLHEWEYLSQLYLFALQLYFLVKLLGCVLVNRHFHYVDVYLHQILPALMTVVLHSGYTPPGEEVCMHNFMIFMWVGYLLLMRNGSRLYLFVTL